MPQDITHFEIVPNKVKVKIYNRLFDKSSHLYLIDRHPKDEVEKNHKLVTDDLGSSALCVLKQIHGIDVADCNDPWTIGNEPEADGLYSNLGDVTLGIQTADCLPVLIASKDGEIIGGAHCGWKSAFGLILSNLVNKIRDKTSANLIAVLGPSIQQYSYEVDEIFLQNFLAQSADNADFFKQGNEYKHFFDLPAYVKKQLKNLDIELVHHFKDDTYSNPDIYPSYRYAMHNGLNGKYRGSILSTITKY